MKTDIVETIIMLENIHYNIIDSFEKLINDSQNLADYIVIGNLLVCAEFSTKNVSGRHKVINRASGFQSIILFDDILRDSIFQISYNKIHKKDNKSLIKRFMRRLCNLDIKTTIFHELVHYLQFILTPDFYYYGNYRNRRESVNFCGNKIQRHYDKICNHPVEVQAIFYETVCLLIYKKIRNYKQFRKIIVSEFKMYLFRKRNITTDTHNFFNQQSELAWKQLYEL